MDQKPVHIVPQNGKTTRLTTILLRLTGTTLSKRVQGLALAGCLATCEQAAFAAKVDSNLPRRQPPSFEQQALSVEYVLVEDDQA